MTDKKAKKEKRTAKFYDDVFNCRIRELMDKNKTRTAELAKKLSISPNAVRLWYTGYGRPEIDKIPVICDFFNVSADWLLGRSEIKSKNLDIADICEKTGLSEKAVNNLVNQNNIEPVPPPIPPFMYSSAREFIWFINSMAEGIDGADGLTKLAHNVVQYTIMRHNKNVQFPKFEDGFEFVAGELKHGEKTYTRISGKEAFEIIMEELRRGGTKFTLIQGEEAVEHYRFLCQQDFLETISNLDKPNFSSTYTVMFKA